MKGRVQAPGSASGGELAPVVAANEAESGALGLAIRHWRLTRRQSQVLDLVARGLPNAVIAEMLDIGKGTVEFHVAALFDKAGVSNRVTLIVRLGQLSN